MATDGDMTPGITVLHGIPGIAHTGIVPIAGDLVLAGADFTPAGILPGMIVGARLTDGAGDMVITEAIMAVIMDITIIVTAGPTTAVNTDVRQQAPVPEDVMQAVPVLQAPVRLYQAVVLQKEEVHPFVAAAIQDVALP